MSDEPNADRGISSVSVVVLDDDRSAGALISRILNRAHCDVTLYCDPGEGLSHIKDCHVDIVITDLQMPDIDGIAVLKEVKAIDPSIDVIIVTGHAEKGVAIDALRLGAFDLLEKPFDPTELTETIKRTVRYRNAIHERDRIAEQLSLLSNREAEQWGIDTFVSRSEAIGRVLKNIALLQKAANTSVLITGESGTGKELVARAIHFGSAKADKPFIPVNCSAVPGELAESILFGHIKGSFTGATTDKKGAFDMANGGTLFLDEIGDMPANIQTKLLRVLEDGIVCPVGQSTGHQVSVRIIAATNCDLHDKINTSVFRSDLYYRLATYEIHIPPLRERVDDIRPLTDHFVASCAKEMKQPVPGVHPDVYDRLARHPFPGNVRELRNLVERAVISGRDSLTLNDFTAGLSRPRRRADQSNGDHDFPLDLKELEAMAIDKAMKKTGGNVSAAARLLGISRTRLYRKLPGATERSDRDS